MKSLVKSVILVISVMASMVALAGSAQAGCWKECILYNPFNGRCVEKMKVCDITNPGAAHDENIQASGRELAGGFKKITEHWHNVYSSILPERYRRILNANSFTIVGAAMGGLSGAAFGQAVDRLVSDYISQDEAIRVDPGLQGWQKDLARELNALHAAERAGGLITKCKAFSIPEAESKLNDLYDTGIACIRRSTDYDGGHRCLAVFRRDAANLTFECHAAF